MDSTVQYRRQFKVITGGDNASDFDGWMAALADSLDELGRRYPTFSRYLLQEGATEAAGAVAVVAAAASEAALIVRRSVPSGPPLQSSTG